MPAEPRPAKKRPPKPDPKTGLPKAAKPPYTVVRDTREKTGHGWTFDESASCAGTVIKKLDTGDYTLLGYEELVTIDRKGALSEFAGNLTQPRFERELERMKSFEYAAIFLEFDFEDLWRWPEGSGIPAAKRRFMRLTRHVLLARFWELKLKFPWVDFVFAGPHGKEAASSLFKRVIEKYGRRKTSDPGPA